MYYHILKIRVLCRLRKTDVENLGKERRVLLLCCVALRGIHTPRARPQKGILATPTWTALTTPTAIAVTVSPEDGLFVSVRAHAPEGGGREAVVCQNPRLLP